MFDRWSRVCFLFCFSLLTFVAAKTPCAQAQVSLLMEEPYGFFGTINPTGHTAFYFERICADTPIHLRRCQSGEMGIVLSRYQGINGYDWVALPLLPYLYSVNRPDQVPAYATREMVFQLRAHYHEANLMVPGPALRPGNFFHGGWTQMIGVAYERRTWAYRFNTTEAQDDALIERLNSQENRSHFSLFYNNCADFARQILNFYFPHSFRRSIFPDLGMTTPRQIVWKLVRLNRKDPQMRLTVYEIPQIPGYRRHSHSNKEVSEALMTTAYALPITVVNPELAGGIVLDYIVYGHHHILPSHPQILTPQTLESLNVSTLTEHASPAENPSSAVLQVPGAATEPSLR